MYLQSTSTPQCKKTETSQSRDSTFKNHKTQEEFPKRAQIIENLIKQEGNNAPVSSFSSHLKKNEHDINKEFNEKYLITQSFIKNQPKRETNQFSISQSSIQQISLNGKQNSMPEATGKQRDGVNGIKLIDYKKGNNVTLDENVLKRRSSLNRNQINTQKYSIQEKKVSSRTQSKFGSNKLEIASFADCSIVKFDLLDLISQNDRATTSILNQQQQYSFKSKTMKDYQFQIDLQSGLGSSSPLQTEQKRKKFEDRKQRNFKESNIGGTGGYNNRGTFLDGSTQDLFNPLPQLFDKRMMKLQERKMQRIKDSLKLNSDLLEILQNEEDDKRESPTVDLQIIKGESSPYFPLSQVGVEESFDDDNLSPISRKISNVCSMNTFQDFNNIQFQKNNANDNGYMNQNVNDLQSPHSETSIQSDVQQNGYTSASSPMFVSIQNHLPINIPQNSKNNIYNGSGGGNQNQNLCSNNAAMNQNGFSSPLEDNNQIQQIKKNLKRQSSVRFQLPPISLEKIREIDEKEEDGATKFDESNQENSPKLKNSQNKIASQTNEVIIKRALSEEEQPQIPLFLEKKDATTELICQKIKDTSQKFINFPVVVNQRSGSLTSNKIHNTLSPEYFTSLQQSLSNISSNSGMPQNQISSQTSIQTSQSEDEGHDQEESLDSSPIRKFAFHLSDCSGINSQRTSIFFGHNTKLVEDQEQSQEQINEQILQKNTEKNRANDFQGNLSELKISETIPISQNDKLDIPFSDQNKQICNFQFLKGSINLENNTPNLLDIPISKSSMNLDSQSHLNIDNNGSFFLSSNSQTNQLLEGQIIPTPTPRQPQPNQYQVLKKAFTTNDKLKEQPAHFFSNNYHPPTSSQYNNLLLNPNHKRNSFLNVNNSIHSNNSYITFFNKNPDQSVIETSQVKKEVDQEGYKKINSYTLLKELGRGGFGKVKLAVTEAYESSDKTINQFAIKISNKKKLKQKLSNMKVNAFTLLEREVAIMKKIDHPHLVKLFEVIDDPDDKKIYMVMEYMQKGSIMSNTYWRKELQQSDPQLYKKVFEEEISQKKRNELLPKKLSLEKCRKYFQQFALGIEYMHNQAQIIHRDIKPENILINEEDNLKIGDFGVSHIMESSEDSDMRDNAGTKAFTAPEGWSRNFKGKPLDMWASGITLYQMAIGELPFFSKDQIVLRDKIINQELNLPQDLDPQLKDLIQKLLMKNPDQRITATEMLVRMIHLIISYLLFLKNHPWITQNGAIQLKNSEMGEIKISDKELQGAFTKKIQFSTLMRLKVQMNRRLSRARSILQISGIDNSMNMDKLSMDGSQQNLSLFRHNSCLKV